MKNLLTALMTALCLLSVAAPAAQAQQSTTGWLSSPEYQSFFDQARYGNLIPVHVEAGLYNGHVRFHATFAQRPMGLRTWATHHGMSDAQFTQTNRNYLSQGYRLHQHQRFTTEGLLLNQGIWYR